MQPADPVYQRGVHLQQKAAHAIGTGRHAERTRRQAPHSAPNSACRQHRRGASEL
jgi:hypothetical protein